MTATTPLTLGACLEPSSAWYRTRGPVATHRTRVRYYRRSPNTWCLRGTGQASGGSTWYVSGIGWVLLASVRRPLACLAGVADQDLRHDEDVAGEVRAQVGGPPRIRTTGSAPQSLKMAVHLRPNMGHVSTHLHQGSHPPPDRTSRWKCVCGQGPVPAGSNHH